MNQDLIGFKVNKTIFCDLCRIRRDGGGFALRKPISGVFCSAAHARIKVAEAMGGDLVAEESGEETESKSKEEGLQ